MIAVLGMPGDPVCGAVTAAAVAAGVPAIRIEDPNGCSLSVTQTPSGAWSGQIAVGGSAGPPTAVFNRGLPPCMPPEVDADLLATWWAALALFDGRVLNRPDSSGFLPQVFLPRASGSIVGSRCPTPPGEGQIANVYDVADGRFRHRLPGPAPADDRRIRTVTTFAPRRCWRLMVVGDRRIDVALPAGGLTPADRCAGLRLVDALLADTTPFALVVLDRAGSGDLRVVAVDPMPGLQHYAAVQDEVHTAVVDWLT